MSYVKINGEQIPFVRRVDTTTGGRTFVRCLTDNDEETDRLFEILNGFKRSSDKLTFDMISSDTLVVKFEGIISFIAKDRRAVNFTAEPIGAAIVK